jgi:uncharacterized protein (DUF1810 family)
MWFIFPQLRGLVLRPSALYGIGALDEARAYLAHPVLGPRLVLCTQTIMGIEGYSLQRSSGRRTT